MFTVSNTRIKCFSQYFLNMMTHLVVNDNTSYGESHYVERWNPIDSAYIAFFFKYLALLLLITFLKDLSKKFLKNF